MYVLKRLHNTVQHIEMHDSSQDPENFSWKNNNKSPSLPDNTDFIFKPENHRNSDMLIHEFLKTNVKGKIIYNLDQFLIRVSMVRILRYDTRMRLSGKELQCTQVHSDRLYGQGVRGDQHLTRLYGSNKDDLGDCQGGKSDRGEG